MRILFMGTPDFAATILDKLSQSGHNIVGVVSQPDKPKGRGHKFMPTDVKVKAQELGLDVYQPESLRDNSFLPHLNELKPDIIIVAAYGKILPEYILNFPKYGCINVHASLLPKYRGAAPIQWAIMNGDEKTGVCIMKMESGLDTGDVASVLQTSIGEYETSAQLFDRLAELGSDLLVDTLSDIEAGTVKYVPQDSQNSTYANKITKDMSVIDWKKSASVVSKLICAMNSFPGAVTTYKGDTLKIYEAEKTEGTGKPGEILGMVKKKGLKVACGQGALYVKTVQFAGSKKMNAEDYARGHEITNGVILGEEI